MSAQKEKPTLQAQLKKRIYHTPSRTVTWLYNVIGSITLLPKYNPHIEVIDDISKEKGACFIIWNHLSRVDHLYTMKAAYPRRYNMVCGYSEFFRSHLRTVFKLNQILPKKVFTLDRDGIKAISGIIKSGGIVTLSPEGMSSIYGTNQPIVPGSGAFLKHFGVPVYFMQMRGQYLTSTKHYLEERKGRTEARLYKLFTPEQLSKLSAAQIDDTINEAFRHDDYEWGIKNHIKWKMHGRSCEHLNEICYKCLRCGKDLTMHAEGDTIRCTACGNGARMNDYYEFEPFDESCVLPETPSKWVERERVSIIEEIRNDPAYSFAAHVTVGDLPTDRYLTKQKTSEVCGEGTMTLDHAGIHFRGTKHGEAWSFDLSYAIYYSLVIMTSTAKFALYVGAEFFEFTPDSPCVGKLLLITEEMHRYHFNSWKNFPWNSWMYEGKALGIDA